MNKSLIIKVNFLILALVAVLLAIKNLRSPSVNEGLTSLFGASSGPTAGVRTSLNWCETRVTALSRPGHEIIREQDLKWYTGKTEIDSIAIEKWLSLHCEIPVARLTVQEFSAAPAEPALTVTFTKGPEVTLYRAGDIFRWREEIFRSEALARALDDLNRIPQAATH